MDKKEILLLEKIYSLSKRLENNKFYQLLKPWQFRSYDLIEVQEAGKIISSFIGMPNLTFVISYTEKNKRTGGHIELNNNNEEGVFIEIDNKFKNDYSIVLAILAHEICHKLIHINGLTQFGYENEILTDVATVYTGLGKLSLNGCETVSFSTHKQVEGDKSLNTVTTTTQKVGYLNRLQFAFVYNVICKMRRIPDNYMFDSLNQEAVIALKANQFNIQEDLFHNEFAISKVNKTISLAHKNIQLLSAENIKTIKILNQLIFKAQEINNNYHAKLKSTSDELLDKAKLNYQIESLNFIKNLILISDLDNMSIKFKKEEEDINSLNKIFSLMLKDISANNRNTIDLKEREFLYLIECPVCKLKMSLRQDKLVRVTCSNCKYSFLIDNRIIDIVNNTRQKDSFKTKIKKIITIMKSDNIKGAN